MLLRHSASYLLARGIPGLLNFAALAIYTRLLTPDEFGRYTLILAATGLVDVVIFQWLRLVLARFIPANTKTPEAVQEPVLAIFICLAATICAVGTGIALLISDPVWLKLIAVAAPLTIAQAWLELNMMLASAQLLPRRFGLLMGTKSVTAFILGSWLAWIGIGTQAPLLGLLAGALIASTIFSVGAWRGMVPRWPTKSSITQYTRYGLPLTLTFALGWIISSSDRYLIAWIMGEDSAGIYAVGYDLASQSIGLLLAAINTAAYPLAVHCLEANGKLAARRQLAINGELIITLAISGAGCLIIFGPEVTEILVGAKFREGALQILPWIAASAAISGIKTYYFDIPLHLARKANLIAAITLTSAIINISLNIALIPRFGLLGSAWASLASLTAATIGSAYLGRHAFPAPPIPPILGRSLAVAGFSLCGALISNTVIEELISKIVLGGFLSILCGLIGALLFNTFNLRRAFATKSKRARFRPKG